MELHDELLDLAKILSDSENQASARRSVSTSYYALFHRLAFEAAHLFFPRASDAPLHTATVRALDHRTMKQVCQWFSGTATYSRPVAALLGGAEVPDSLKRLARAFIRLQEARHDADYNIQSDFRALQAQKSLAEVQKAFEILESEKDESIYRLFLGSLLFANSWRL